MTSNKLAPLPAHTAQADSKAKRREFLLRKLEPPRRSRSPLGLETDFSTDSPGPAYLPDLSATLKRSPRTRFSSRRGYPVFLQRAQVMFVHCFCCEHHHAMFHTPPPPQGVQMIGSAQHNKKPEKSPNMHICKEWYLKCASFYEY